MKSQKQNTDDFLKLCEKDNEFYTAKVLELSKLMRMTLVHVQLLD